MPFTISGDVNDASFPMLDSVLQNLKLFSHSRTQGFIHLNLDVRPDNDDDSNTSHVQTSGEQKYVIRNSSDDKLNNLLVSDRTRSSALSGSTNEEEVRKHQDLEKPRKMIEQQKEVTTYISKKGTYSEKEIMEFRLKFTRQMKDNEDQLNRLCEEDIKSSQRPSKLHIRAYSTAIFSLSTIPDTKDEPKKTSEIHRNSAIPLKFPWNGVFDTSIPLCLENRPSVLFFFEVSQQK